MAERKSLLVIEVVATLTREAAQLDDELPDTSLALALNSLARRAGEAWADALGAQNDTEAEQRRLYAKLYYELREAGESKTAAHDAVLCDSDYIEHRRLANAFGAAAMRAESVYRAALQRATLIARIARDT